MVSSILYGKCRSREHQTSHTWFRIYTRYKILNTKYSARSAGFTLVEMIVAVALFAVVMLVSVGALLSLTAANRKAQALQSVINNLNVALDGMVRSIRMGSDYHCGGGTYALPQDCAVGGTALAFEAFGGILMTRPIKESIPMILELSGFINQRTEARTPLQLRRRRYQSKA